jgi:hypothetical protein
MRSYPKPEPKEKQYKCKHCKDPFVKKGFNQKYCMAKKACIKAFLDSERKLKEKAEQREWNKHKKEQIEKMKTLSQWKDDLQIVVNWIARELDKDQPCISHPEVKDFLRYDAGHYYTVKSHSDIRFNLHNIHKQNSESNERHGGNADYTRGLKQRYGQDYLDMVLGLPLRYEGTGKEKYTIPNIRDIYLPNARKVKREMMKGADFTRDQVNEMIGIY